MRHILLSDFDETISKDDTIGILAQVAYQLKPHFKPPWSHFVDFYEKTRTTLGDCTIRKGSLLPNLIQEEVTKRYSRVEYVQMLDSKFGNQDFDRRIEMASTNEIARLGLFSGIDTSRLIAFVEKKYKCETPERCLLRDDFIEFASHLMDWRDFYIISANWSKEFIHTLMNQRSFEFENIYCNNLISRDGIYTGNFSNKLLCGQDKYDIVSHIVGTVFTYKQEERLWYIGDSETDLLAIFHPDVNGVLVLDPSQKPKKFSRIVLEFLGVEEMVVESFCHGDRNCSVVCYEKFNGNCVYLSKSWDGIDILLKNMS